MITKDIQVGGTLYFKRIKDVKKKFHNKKFTVKTVDEKNFQFKGIDEAGIEFNFFPTMVRKPFKKELT